MRSIYEIRERRSRMYSWTALVTSQIIVAVPWNIVGSFILFVTFYWTLGFESSRAGYTFLILVLAFPAYYTTFAQVGYISFMGTYQRDLKVLRQAVAAMSPNAEIAAILFSLLFSFVITLYVETSHKLSRFPGSDDYILIVMVSCRLTANSIGGNGCTICRLTRI